MGQTEHRAAMREFLSSRRAPHDHALIELVGELSTRSEVFRRRPDGLTMLASWAATQDLTEVQT